MKKLLIILLSCSTLLFAQKVWEGNYYQATSHPQYETAEFAINQLPKKNYQSIGYREDSPIEFENPFVIGVAQKNMVTRQTYQLLPHHLYKIVSIENWNKSKNKNNLVLSEIDKDFIHFSSNKKQVEYVVNKYWKDNTYILLTIDTQKTPGTYKLEYNSKKTDQFWHLYNGSIPHNAIVKIKIIEP